jgi:hypothetical protein
MAPIQHTGIHRKALACPMMDPGRPSVAQDDGNALFKT